MKKTYISPQAEMLPLSMEQSLCGISDQSYLIIGGAYDDDSD